MRYFLELAYDGGPFHGWQRQDNAPSVQQTLEQGLGRLLRREIEVTGAGRTDSGGHAAYYVAHFDVAHLYDATVVAGVGGVPDALDVNEAAETHEVIDDAKDFVYRLNAVLPYSIAIKGITAVHADAHARFDASSREYKYYLLPYKDPFRRGGTWQYYVDLNMEAMNRAAAMLLGRQEFTTFSKLHSGNKTDVCNVMHAAWEPEVGAASPTVGGGLVFTIRADRFLRNMVRSVVAALVDVGRGKIRVWADTRSAGPFAGERVCACAGIVSVGGELSGACFQCFDAFRCAGILVVAPIYAMNLGRLLPGGVIKVSMFPCV